MEYLNSFFDFCKLSISVLFEIWADLLFKIAGNLFPFYIGAFILLLVDTSSISKVFDPQSFIIYSSTFLFSTIYLWYKTLEKNNKVGLLLLLIFILQAIVISFLYAFTYTDKLDYQFNFNAWSYRIFIVSILMYVVFECINYFRENKSSFASQTKKSYSNLKDSFHKLKENE
ncbi:hypothetical protein [uncultured Planktosalinus sp.]|uniref:hypothetical protein n=1 Tax=uncultured Planktosalinus sp. TaxID=1810935 RepID=UPI0030DC7AEB